MSLARNAAILEGFALETVEGLIFTVKGLVHPPQAVIAYLRYVPHPQGRRERHGVRYRRVYHFPEQVHLLRTRFPHYLFFDPVLGRQLQGVPRARLRRIYDPRRQLAGLRRHGPADAAEEAALRFCELLSRMAGVPLSCLGVSGSVLLGLHTSASDLDVVVYGSGPARRVHRALRNLWNDPTGEVAPLDEAGLQALHSAHAADTGVPFADFIRLQQRKVNEGRYRGREYFIRFVKDAAEVGEEYGDRRYTPLGAACIQARVLGDAEAILTPCCYQVGEVRFLAGSPVSDLREVTSYRGRFADQARAGEQIIAQGELERVTWRDGTTYHRLIVGGRPGDYLIALLPE